MKNFKREDLNFSLCGLNCALCTMKLDHYCPGCGGGAGNQSCAIARCSLYHGNVMYCFQCKEYPCDRYKGFDEFDSFITHHNRLKDMVKIQNMGIEPYHNDLKEKAEILKTLLAEYNDGRHKSFFCTAVNLLELQEIREIMGQILAQTAGDRTLKEKTADAVGVFQSVAEKKGVSFKLRRKTGKISKCNKAE